MTVVLCSCCADIVREEMQKGLELQEENADQEFKDLQKLQVRDYGRTVGEGSVVA